MSMMPKGNRVKWVAVAGGLILVAAIVIGMFLTNRWSSQLLVVIAYAKVFLMLLTAGLAIWAAYMDVIDQDKVKKRSALWGAALTGFLAVVIVALEGVNSVTAANASAKQAARSAADAQAMEAQIAVILTKANTAVAGLNTVQQKVDGLTLGTKQSLVAQKELAKNTIDSVSRLQGKANTMSSRIEASSSAQQKMTSVALNGLNKINAAEIALSKTQGDIKKTVSWNVAQLDALNYALEIDTASFRLDWSERDNTLSKRLLKYAQSVQNHVGRIDLSNVKPENYQYLGGYKNDGLYIAYDGRYITDSKGNPDYNTDKREVTEEVTIKPTSSLYTKLLPEHQSFYITEKAYTNPDVSDRSSYLLYLSLQTDVADNSDINVNFDSQSGTSAFTWCSYKVTGFERGQKYALVGDYRNLCGKYLVAPIKDCYEMKVLDYLNLRTKNNDSIALILKPVKTSVGKDSEDQVWLITGIH